MTIQDFHIAIDIEVDKTIDFEYPYISPEQKDYWINKAIGRFIKSRAFGNNIKLTTFEEDQKRTDDLRSLIPPVHTGTVTPVSEGVYNTALPSDYLHLIRHQCRTTSPKTGTQTVGGTQVKQDNLNIILSDPFKRPYAKDPAFYIKGNEIFYEGVKGFSIDAVLIHYLRKPAIVAYGSEYLDKQPDVQCDLPEHTHPEILDLTVAMLLENIQSQRYQTNLNELTKSE